MRKMFKCASLILFLISCLVESAIAGEQGHYSPAPIAVRDYILPPKGFYVVVYNPYYHSGTFKDSSGDKFDSITSTGTITRHVSIAGHDVPVTLTGTLNAKLDLKVDSATQMIALLWSSEDKILGADYGFLIAPAWGYMRLKAKANLSGAGTITIGNRSRTLAGSGSAMIEDDKMGLADLMVEPLWLAWRGKHYDIGLSNTFFFPTGAYDKDDLANVGFGFFTNRLQANFYYYPFENKATAFMITPTYEWNSKKIDKDVQPGQVITLEYGISQYLHPRLEVAVHGYSQWQVSEDHGSAAANKDVKDRINGIGGHITWWAVKNKCAVVGKYIKEYGAKDRFEGAFGSLNVTWIF
jgi:hypothetical protein